LYVYFQVWNTYTGEDMFTLEGHKNVVSVRAGTATQRPCISTLGTQTAQLPAHSLKAQQTAVVIISCHLVTTAGFILQVYAIAFNNPYGDKVVTGSFDKTAKL
jgi:dynein assembly factor with WDR repeat domains 1